MDSTWPGVSPAALSGARQEGSAVGIIGGRVPFCPLSYVPFGESLRHMASLFLPL